MSDASSGDLTPYLPRLVRAWSDDPDGPRVRVLDGSIVSIDISGFTALAERLQAKGKEGAEELVTRISGVFDNLISAAERHGGDVLKFRGDALLLLFVGERHPERACGAGSDMQWTIERIGLQETSLGPVELRMSVGVHTDDCHLFLTETPHRELLVAGPAATRVFELEDLASAGEIMISAQTAAAVDPAWVGAEKEGAFLMVRLEPGASVIPPPRAVPGRDLHEYVPRPLRHHLAVSSGEAEHRRATVAFLKLSGTDSVIAAEGPEEVLDRIDRVAEAVGHACEAYGITWLESDIDVDAAKLYLTAGAPATSGDDEEGMIRALRDVIAACPDLTLRAGVNRGHVFTGDIGAATRSTYAVMGDTVNLAARLCGKAEPGEIVTTTAVLDRARTVYRTAVRMLKVKGKALEIEAHVVGEVLGKREPDDHLTGLLVGRDAELGRLLDALGEAREGRQQVVELVGPPGIGKSRLLAELSGRADDAGFERVTTVTDPYSSGEPYAGFRTLLRKVAGIADDASREEAGAKLAALVADAMPDLTPWTPLLAIPIDADAAPTPEASGLDPERSRVRIQQLVETFLDRLLTNPTLITVEDAHWLDDASEFLVRHIVDGPRGRCWLIVVTTRPGTARFARDGVNHATTIELTPLPDDMTAQLTLGLAGEYDLPRHEVEALVARAGGNPLFVRELVAAASRGQSIDSLPDTVESLLTTRIDTLDPTDRLLLRYASVLGMSFDLDVLPEILGDELQDAGAPARWLALDEFVVPTDNGVLAFRHNLVRETAYEGLSYRRRRDIHGRVGLVLERRLGTRRNEEAALLSLHFHEAADHERAWHYSTFAAARAAEGYANVVAAELYERGLAAADHLERLPTDEIAATAEALGDVCERFGAYERARAGYATAAGLWADAPIAATRIAGKEAAVDERVGEYDHAIAGYKAALARLDGLERGEEALRNRADLELGIAGVLYRKGQSEESVEWAQRAAAHAEEIDDRERLAHALYLTAGGYNDLGRADGIEYCNRALAIYRELSDYMGMGRTLNNLGVRLYYEGRWDEAARAWDDGRNALERAGASIEEATLANNIGEILSDQGRLAEAEPHFRHYLRTSRAAGSRFGVGAATSNLARLAARAGSFDEALELYDDALTTFEQLGARVWWLETAARKAEALVLMGRERDAIDLAAQALDDPTVAGAARVLLERSIGLAECAAGALSEGHAHLVESLRLADELGSSYERALTLKALAVAGLPDAAARNAEADVVLERLGVLPTPVTSLP